MARYMLNHLFLLAFDALHVLHDIILYNHFVEAAPQPAPQVASPDVTNTVPINSELPNPAASTVSGKLIIRCFHMHDCVSLCVNVVVFVVHVVLDCCGKASPEGISNFNPLFVLTLMYYCNFH